MMLLFCKTIKYVYASRGQREDEEERNGQY